MTKEQLETLLVNAPNVTGVAWINENKYEFSRECEFHVRGTRYVIRWFTNICYLIIGEAEVMFEEIEVTGTWPNNFKTNLNFYQYRGDHGETGIIAIIPIEEYKSQTQEATS